MIEGAIVAAATAALVSVGGTVWTLLKEKYQARRDKGREITLAVGDGPPVTLYASDFKREDLQALIHAVEDAQETRDQRLQAQQSRHQRLQHE